MVTINVSEKDEKLNIVIDYTNLIKMVDSNISECVLEVVITDINKIEKFLVSDSNENVLQS